MAASRRYFVETSTGTVLELAAGDGCVTFSGAVSGCALRHRHRLPALDSHAIKKTAKGGKKGLMEKAMKQIEIGGDARLVRRSFTRRFHPAKHLISSGRQAIPVYSTGVGPRPVSILLFRDSINPFICPPWRDLCSSVAKTPPIPPRASPPVRLPRSKLD
jgi:hypothetical protein